MQLHQLEYFVAVVDEGSITRAAARLRIAQPGVSAQIRKLERELGATLFDRTGHPVSLTPVGAEIATAARAALAAVADVSRVADELAGLRRGRISVGAVTSGRFLDLPEVLGDFHAAHPQVEVTLTEGGSRVLRAALQQGQLDLALIGLTGPDPDPDELDVHTVSDETLVLAAAPTSPLADRGSLELAELADHVFVAPAAGNALRDTLDAAFAAIGGTPRVGFEANDPGVIARMVARGLGIAILPDSLHGFRNGDLRAVALTGTLPRSRLVLAWPRARPRSPATRALTQRLLDAIEQH